MIESDEVAETDVLIIGGGLAGTWAAVGAARAGARVILAEKGYCGTSGVTATAGPGHWWVPPDPTEARPAAVRERLARAFGLAEASWMERIIDLTWRTLPTLAPYYKFSTDDRGVVQYRGLRGPEYMRAMRRLVSSLGVTILDHSPALELLVDDDDVVAGARLRQRQIGRTLTVKAGAVVLATGGCAFRSDLLGSRNNTGDGYLMGAEVGAELSGMEFTAYYTVAPKHSTMTRSMAYSFACYFDQGGAELPIPKGPDTTRALASALLQGPVFCSLSDVPEDIRAVMPLVQPNFVLPFARWGIDPYQDRFEVTLHGEGTVRGIGGLNVTNAACQTSVPALYAAGDAATRELIAGATSGGGAQNSAWALSSGQWAGAGAATTALRRRRRSQVMRTGIAGFRPRRQSRALPTNEIVSVVKTAMLGYREVLFRNENALQATGKTLESAWAELRDYGSADGDNAIALRELAAILATARWSNRAALERHESRGMHQRVDQPESIAKYSSRQVLTGIDAIETSFHLVNYRPALAS